MNSEPKQTHTDLRSVTLPHAKQAMAKWALNPTGHLVVFVHGFSGHATKTWHFFPTETLLSSSEGQGADFLFYGYKSVFRGAEESGLCLFMDLNLIWGTPGRFFNSFRGSSEMRQDEFRYTRMTIVAHSLGAIVSRHALLDHFDNGNPWGSNIRLALFAPAHKGAEGALLFSQCLTLGMIPSPVAKLPSLFFKSLRDLERGSKKLEILEKRSEIAFNSSSPTGTYVKAHSVVWLIGDRIVENEKFCEDPVAMPVQDRSHISVCKPDNEYLLPVDVVKKAMS